MEPTIDRKGLSMNLRSASFAQGQCFTATEDARDKDRLLRKDSFPLKPLHFITPSSDSPIAFFMTLSHLLSLLFINSHSVSETEQSPAVGTPRVCL